MKFSPIQYIQLQIVLYQPEMDLSMCVPRINKYTCTSAPSAGASGQRGAAYGQGSGPILLDQVQCFGNESDIFDCPQNDIGMHNCIHDEDAGVTCTTRESLINHFL